MTDFNPREPDREAREEGWKEETEKFAELLHNRGDQRIGQLIMNAVRLNEDGTLDPEELEQELWNMEAPAFVEALEEYMEIRKS